MIRFNVNGAGFKGATVDGRNTLGFGPTDHAGQAWQPQREAVRALLPHRWRAAFDRSTLQWSREPFGALYTLRDRRGRHLTTVYAWPAVTPGQAAYEAELMEWPYDHTGRPRSSWAALSDFAKASWEKYPTPRERPPYASKQAARSLPSQSGAYRFPVFDQAEA